MDIHFSCVRARVCFYGHLRVYVRVDHNLFDLRYFPPSICAIKMVDFVSRFWVCVCVCVCACVCVLILSQNSQLIRVFCGLSFLVTMATLKFFFIVEYLMFTVGHAHTHARAYVYTHTYTAHNHHTRARAHTRGHTYTRTQTFGTNGLLGRRFSPNQR